MYQIIVCMPYKLDWTENVWDALSRITERDRREQLQIDRVDTTDVTEDLLAQHIESEISKADVIIADVTEQNPGVYLEIGYALAWKKPLLLITQDSKWLAAHLRGRVFDRYDLANTEALGRLTTTMLHRIRDKLDVIAAKKETDNAKAGLEATYQVECYCDRAMVGLERYFRGASERIDILTTNLSFLFEDYKPSPNEPQCASRTYFDEIKNALDRERSRVKVRVLTLDPDSDFAAKRGKQLGFAAAVFRDMLRQAWKDVKEKAAQYPSDRFEVRTYEDFPNQITFRIDNWIFNCVVAQPTQSRNHLTFKLDRQQRGVDNSFMNHFQNVWGKASTS